MSLELGANHGFKVSTAERDNSSTMAERSAGCRRTASRCTLLAQLEFRRTGVAMGSFRVRWIAVAVAVVSMSPTACGAESGPAPASVTPAPTERPVALPVPQDILAKGAVAIRATPNPDWAVAAAGSVLVSGVDPGLKRYDAAAGVATGEVSIYSVCMAMDYGFDSVWAASCSYDAPSVMRVDANTGQPIAEIRLPARLPAESSIGAGEGAVWVLTSGSDRKLLAIDPGRNAVARTFPAPEGAAAVRAGLGSIWVTVGSFANLIRLDPRSGTVIATIAVGKGPRSSRSGPMRCGCSTRSTGRCPGSTRGPARSRQPSTCRPVGSRAGTSSNRAMRSGSG